ncbi:hypothetical protein M408DRAFT_8981 [Serendipita vermifera MAFF 305830]|uniref:Uncharacterized protein n=1 Tax=Serendipita vermifera MAFF 305830 TaxID=933852 RepID=A0A0C3AU16_SERVB|nr:hypothetical protein M408DRAFT_8981 [Serendipita vermifera MAFF 305830]
MIDAIHKRQEEPRGAPAISTIIVRTKAAYDLKYTKVTEVLEGTAKVCIICIACALPHARGCTTLSPFDASFTLRERHKKLCNEGSYMTQAESSKLTEEFDVGLRALSIDGYATEKKREVDGTEFLRCFT